MMQVNDDDITLLKVKGDKAFNNDKQETKKYVKSLSNAILKVIEKHGSAKLKGVGASALNHAIKAAAIAREEGKKNNLDLVIIPTFDEVNFDEGNTKTAMILKVESRPIIKTSECPA